MMKKQKSFTLIEVVVTVIVLGVVASFGYVGYYKFMERAYENHAIQALLTIGAAEKMYYARYGDYWPGTGKPLESIEVTNAALGTSVTDIPGKMAIICGGTDIGYQCRAFYVHRGQIKWIVESRATLLEGRPFCADMNESCPTCKNPDNGGCI